MADLILILTRKEDAHADQVVRCLQQRSIDVFRLNTEDILSNYKLRLHISSIGDWGGAIENEVGRTLDLSEARVAWLRKPNLDFRFADGRHSEFIASEARAFIDTLYALPSIKWVNDPFRANRSKVKFQQLILASNLGLKVPDTLITTMPEVAKTFFAQHRDEVLSKNIYTSSLDVDGFPHAVVSVKISGADFHANYLTIAFAPTQLQGYIEKAFELRITVIGDRVFAVRIDSQANEKTKIDWRMHTKLNPHSVYKLPSDIGLFCVEFLKKQRLDFGAFDFIVTPEGEHVFLENNPFGQYLWLEHETGLPITEAICDFLVAVDTKSPDPAEPLRTYAG